MVEENTDSKRDLETLRQKVKVLDVECTTLRSENKALRLSSAQAEAQAREAQNSE